MPSTPLRLGFLSPHNPYDRRAFSGTSFYAANALRQALGVRLRILGSHRPVTMKQRLLRQATPKLDVVDPGQFEGLDAVVGMVASKLIDPILPKLDIPYIHVTDATPGFLRECYGWDIPAEIDAREARVARGSDAVVYSSMEMAVLAAQELRISALSAPFGINLEKTRLPTTAPAKPSLNKLNLLFVGNDWARKGGDIAVGALDRLLDLGLNAHLTVVGRVPDLHQDNPAITRIGYLNKNRPDHAAKLSRLYAEAHLLLLPSRADCTPMVAAEAMAHGTPVLASAVGGLGTLLGGQGAGRLLSLEASQEDWAREICAVTADQFAYQMLSEASFDRAQTRLTWTAWRRDLLSTIEALRQAQGTERLRIVAA
ncbi:MAG: glycosyltransferase family 4 protein [Pseudomonadota bacterium]